MKLTRIISVLSGHSRPDILPHSQSKKDSFFHYQKMEFYKQTTNLCDIKLRECVFFNNMFKSILFNKWNIFLYYTNETHNISFELQICQNANSPENCIYDAIFTIERAPPPFTNDGKSTDYSYFYLML